MIYIWITILVYYQQRQRPTYSIDHKHSRYNSHRIKNNEHVFTVQQGKRFYLKLYLNAYPKPKDEDLYKDSELLQYDPNGTIYSGVDFMEIQRVVPNDAGKYKISSRNSVGEGHFSFRLKVKCKLF